MFKKKAEKEAIARALKKAELLDWFNEKCLWAKRVDPNGENRFSSDENWEVAVPTGPNTSITFGAKTFADVVGVAKKMLEGEN